MSPDPFYGVLVAVVGPSGAGKDTLMSLAARHFAPAPDIRFARRIVTRDAVAELEDHESLDEAAFDTAFRDGAFCLTWAAHGLRYALPVKVAEDVAAGRVVVANVSRGCLKVAAASFPGLRVVEITARPDLLLARILARGREDEAAVKARLDRQVALHVPPEAADHVRIDNSGDPAAAGATFVRFLETLRRKPSTLGEPLTALQDAP